MQTKSTLRQKASLTTTLVIRRPAPPGEVGERIFEGAYPSHRDGISRADSLVELIGLATQDVQTENGKMRVSEARDAEGCTYRVTTPIPIG
jgi:hypothetical protein